MNPASKQHLLDQANASIRRGARQRYIAIPVFVGLLGLGVYQSLPTNAVVTARWAIVILLGALALLLMLDGRRWSHLRLTPQGLEHESFDPMVRWSEIVEVNYEQGFKLRLHDQFDRTVYVKLLYVSSPKPVLAAIRAHLPPGVTINGPYSSARRHVPVS